MSLNLYCLIPLAAVVAGAQSTTTPTTTAASSSSSTTSTYTGITTHTIAAGQNGFSFTPATVQADVGDVIEWQFYPSNHSVARAAYEYPCIPYEDVGTGNVGFWSGFEPVSQILEDPPNFQVTVNDSNPIFFYCSAPGACINDGMVGVINPTANETLQIQVEFAKNSTIMISPGQSFPSEGASSTSASATATATSTSTSTASATSTAVATSSSSGSKLSTGAIVGIAIGGAAVAILAAAVLYLCGRQKTISEILRSHKPSRSAHTDSFLPGPMSHGPLSPMSESAYSSKRPYSETTGIGRLSHQPGYNDHMENESYRSRSPPLDEMMQQYQSVIPQAPSEMGNNGDELRKQGPDGSPMWAWKGGDTAVSGLNRSFSTGPGPHELAAPNLPTPPNRSFSFIEGGRGYAQTPNSPKDVSG